MTLVASLPCFDRQVFGPGFFRASTDPLIAVAGAMMIAPVLADPAAPQSELVHHHMPG